MIDGVYALSRGGERKTNLFIHTSNKAALTFFLHFSWPSRAEKVNEAWVAFYGCFTHVNVRKMNGNRFVFLLFVNV